jgi:hypothetical protein
VIDVIASPLVPWDGSEPMVRTSGWGDDSKMPTWRLVIEDGYGESGAS